MKNANLALAVAVLSAVSAVASWSRVRTPAVLRYNGQDRAVAAERGVQRFR